MNNALKGALLSGLIVPGLGQIVLKHYVKGTVMMVTVLASLTVLTIKTVQIALAIVKKVQLGSEEINIGTISNIAIQASTSFEGLTFTPLLLVIVALWIVGVVDAYMIGRKIDIELSS